ncbi:GAF domain-containing protein [Antrihabitans cavernicola]|uniref:GAF domain-containing protein n=1 Tax=Antrihabitans cavernicola TaxID=2495913 RepID=A0A5A7S3V5_9NOCA|nr:GAF domain-containing protein [Spelaeibacter cavernicola]KAA0017661.1 GAF domain-containing protein [Spelaeibacter cavernicola]
MFDQHLLIAALSRYVRTLPTLYESEFVLDDLADTVTEVLGVTGAGVSLVSDERLWFVTSSTGNMVEVELWQEHYQDGPARTAYETDAPVCITDIGDCGDRWPLYAAAAHDAGVVAVGAIPMRLGDDIIGVLDLYADDPRAWPAPDIAAAQLLADIATGYLVNASTPAQHTEIDIYNAARTVPAVD